MASPKQESGQFSPPDSSMVGDLENGSDSSSLSDDASPSPSLSSPSPVEVSSGASSSDSSGSSSDSDSSDDSSDSSGSSDKEDICPNEEESKAPSGSSDKEAICLKRLDEEDPKASDSSGSSDKKVVKKAVCLLNRLEGKSVMDHASKKVFFTKDHCRWTDIEHPVSVNKVRNFVQTADNAIVNVNFEGTVTNVDITLGDDPEEKLRIKVTGSSEWNCVTVAEEFRSPCFVDTEDVDNIGSYDPSSGTYLRDASFGTSPDTKFDLQKKKENNGVVKFETQGLSYLKFSFGKRNGKDTVHISFSYGSDESHELGFDFEVSGKDLNLNLPSSLTTTTTTLTPENIQTPPEVEEEDECDTILQDTLFRTPESTSTTTTSTASTTTTSTINTTTSSTSTTTTMHSTTGGSLKRKEKKT